MTFETRKNACKEELYAYLMLRKHIFNNKHVIIGDEGQNGLPDIYSDDFKIGLEVTVAEEASSFEIICKFFGSVTQSNFDKNNLKFISNKNYSHLKLANISKKQKLRMRKKVEDMSLDGILDSFAQILHKKLVKLNTKSVYSKVKSPNLVVLSDFIPKDFVTIEDYKDVYDEISEMFDKKFDNTFIFLNNEIYTINSAGNIKILSDYESTLTAKKSHNYNTNLEM